jgi:hypothetical protein
MCTVSWTSDEGGCYQLFFNRDEQRSRPRAKRPQLFERDGRGLIAPIDERSQGSWMAVNDLGVCAFLLNGYEVATSDGKTEVPLRSRGEIPISLCGQFGFDRSLDTLMGLEPERFPPFFAGLIGPEDGARIFCWNGLSFEERLLELPFLTTSSFQSEAVQTYRRDRFLELCHPDGPFIDPEKLLDYHRDSIHANGAFNPLMSRGDAETHCLSSISVDSRAARYQYREVDPGNGKLRPPLVIELKLRAKH